METFQYQLFLTLHQCTGYRFTYKALDISGTVLNLAGFSRSTLVPEEKMGVIIPIDLIPYVSHAAGLSGAIALELGHPKDSVGLLQFGVKVSPENSFAASSLSRANEQIAQDS